MIAFASFSYSSSLRCSKGAFSDATVVKLLHAPKIRLDFPIPRHIIRLQIALSIDNLLSFVVNPFIVRLVIAYQDHSPPISSNQPSKISVRRAACTRHAPHRHFKLEGEGGVCPDCALRCLIQANESSATPAEPESEPAPITPPVITPIIRPTVADPPPPLLPTSSGTLAAQTTPPPIESLWPLLAAAAAATPNHYAEAIVSLRQLAQLNQQQPSTSTAAAAAVPTSSANLHRLLIASLSATTTNTQAAVAQSVTPNTPLGSTSTQHPLAQSGGSLPSSVAPTPAVSLPPEAIWPPRTTPQSDQANHSQLAAAGTSTAAQQQQQQQLASLALALDPMLLSHFLTNHTPQVHRKCKFRIAYMYFFERLSRIDFWTERSSHDCDLIFFSP